MNLPNLFKRMTWRLPISWMKITAIFLVITIAMVVVGVVYAAAIVVDTFDNASQAITLVTAGTDESFATDATIPSSILGNERDIQATNFGGGFLIVGVDSSNNGRLDFGAGPGATGNALVQWDGIDATMALNIGGLCPTPATCPDFTDGNQNDSFMMRIVSNDLPVDITIRAYTSAANWSEYSFSTTGGIDLGDVVDIVIPFVDFATHGTGADWQTIGALEMFIDASVNQDVDLSIDFFNTDGVRDFGDLPVSYSGLTLLPTGARHIPQGLRLGPNADAQVDVEVDGQPHATAGSDLSGGDDGIPIGGPNDEDGVTRDMADFWTNLANVDLNVEVFGCTGTCFLNGWIDWDGDNSFAGQQIFIDVPVYDGPNTLTIQVPDDTVYNEGSPVFSRFRLCATDEALPAGCNSLTGETSNGEMEDYWWDFGPTAVELVSVEANTNYAVPFALLAGALILLVSGGAILIFKRRRA